MIIILILYLAPFVCILFGIILLLNGRANQHNEAGSSISLAGSIILIVGLILLAGMLFLSSALGE
ncbi:MAG: hypothetical protein GY810_32080 [Aureispira sp.]|nr:hypothetical protein [Aureispira sp.]